MSVSSTRKVFRSSKLASAGVVVSDKSAALIGSSRSFIIADNRGLTLKGPISFVTPSHEIRVGAFWCLTPDILAMFPSTIVSPIPRQFLSPPVVGLLQMSADVAFFTGMIAATAVV